jgi:SanA protein
VSQDTPLDDNPSASGPSLSERIKQQALVESAYAWSFFKKWLARGIFISLHLVVILGGFYAVVWWSAHGACYSSIDRVPVRMVGLVLGCVKKIGPHDNEYFTERVEAATSLYRAGKVQYLIVTGDNSRHGYDEPTDLKAALVEKGVPADHIYCDYAGFRTLDSVLRAHKVFGQEDCTIISQHFHNERAVYLAKRSGMPDTVAFNAKNPESASLWKMHLRELFARVAAVFDVEFFGTQPKFLGKHIAIGPKDPPVDAQPAAANQPQ